MERCRKCKAELPEGAKFCPACGTKQNLTQKPKSRGNGQGSVFKRGSTWTAIRTLGYTLDMDGKLHRQTASKGGFKTKSEAIAYLPLLTATQEAKAAPTLDQLYEAWEPTHQASRSTINCYRAAYKYFAPLANQRFKDIDIDDLQECVDECQKGKRTKENMKALAGLLYKYAIPRHHAEMNLGQYIRIKASAADEKEALPMEAVNALMAARRSIPYAGYIVAQCYLGFRPSELLALDAKDYDRQERAFVGGAKTEAGTNRLVTVSPKIQPIIDELIKGRITGQVFCREDGGPLTISVYRDAFYNALDAIGFDNPMVGEGDARRHRYTPHSCRHTFATLIKGVQAPDQDKLKIIGHTSTEMLRHYQDTDLESLRRITDAI